MTSGRSSATPPRVYQHKSSTTFVYTICLSTAPGIRGVPGWHTLFFLCWWDPWPLSTRAAASSVRLALKSSQPLARASLCMKTIMPHWPPGDRGVHF